MQYLKLINSFSEAKQFNKRRAIRFKGPLNGMTAVTLVDTRADTPVDTKIDTGVDAGVDIMVDTGVDTYKDIRIKTKKKLLIKGRNQIHLIFSENDFDIRKNAVCGPTSDTIPLGEPAGADFIENFEKLGLRLRSKHSYAGLTEVGQTLKKRRGRKMPAYMQDAAVFVNSLYRLAQLTTKNAKLFSHRKQRNAGVVHGIADLAEYPRRSNRSPAYHDSVDTVFLKSLYGTFRSSDVSVADDRNFHAWVGFQLADKSPVGLSGIHLAARASMHCNGLDAAVLKPGPEVADYLIFAVPPQTGLDRNRDADRFHHLQRDGKHFRDIAQHSGAGAFGCHFLYGASEINIEKIRPRLLHDFRGFDHRFGLASVNLDCHGALALVDMKLARGGIDIAYQSLGRNKFGINELSPHFAAYKPERGIRDVFHRSKHHSAFAKVKVCYLHDTVSYQQRVSVDLRPEASISATERSSSAVIALTRSAVQFMSCTSP